MVRGSWCRRQRAVAVRVVLFLGLFSGVLVPAWGAAGQDSGGVPPAGCVVALGALAAGSVVTREGSWDGGGGCRSANAGGGARFARFLSFTVSVPLEARFSLSSSHANRLFLLEGAGTGGRVLASAGAERATWFASFWRVLQPGSYTLETTTRHTEQEGEFTVEIDSMALSPADSCTASLGAVAAGAAVAHSGAWDRGDGCRSVNATADRESRYYADYLSFTVSEAVDVSVRLSGGGGKRLYLLQGAGAGGRVVASASGRRGGPVALRRTLAPGAYTLETAAYSRSREGAYTLSVAAAPVPPTAGGAIAAQEIQARPGAARVELSAAFAGTVDSYTAASSDTSVLTATVDGSVLTLNGAKTGTATVTVTATNTAGSAQQSFTVTVSAVTAPEPEGALAARTLPAGASVEVDVSAGFSGAVDSYTAASSDTSIATVSVNGPALTLTGAKAGAATVTVTAANTAGSATQTMAVSVTSAAPAAVGALAAQTITAGDSAEVDMSGAFSGTVDSYTVTSSDAAVVGVALAGPVVTLTGVAAGTATVTVTAANAAGGATQTMAVTVGLPPPPALAAPLAAQTLQVTETLTVNVASGFAGRIDAYTAVAGDTDKLTVAVDGAEVALTGARAGATTVTVTAINAAGRAARSFAVTVEPLTPPRAAGAPVPRTIAVGEELPIDVADAFSGVIRHYRATSNAPSIVTVGVDRATVTLTGIAAGTATVTLQAVNDAGAAAQTLPVTVQTPDELAVAVNAPSHCLGSEGTLAPGGGRRGVGTIRLTYHVTGGAPPYAITSPDSPDTAAEPTGALTVPCSRRGVDLAAAGPDVNVVEAGPRTLTLTATDNTGATTATNIGIEVAENAYTTAYNGGLMHPGRTYVLGTREQWVLITLPEGLTLRFTGLSEHNIAHFTEPATGAELVLDWTTGKELGRTLPTSNAADRAQSSDGQPTTTTAPPTTTTLFNSLAAKKPADVKHGAHSTEWRPYAGLPNIYEITFEDGSKKFYVPQVAVHPRMLIGEPIRVCATPVNSATAADDQEFKDYVKASVKAWNDSVTDPKKGWNPSFSRALFRFFDDCTSTTDPELNADLEVKRVNDADIGDSSYCSRPVAGCARIMVTGTNPPMIGGREVIVQDKFATTGRTVIHELGHFLGLGDYSDANTDKCDDAGLSPYFVSVMATMKCWAGSIQPRDLADLYLVYHPYERAGIHFEAVGARGWKLNPGDPPRDTGRIIGQTREYRYVSNAAGYVVYRRAFDSTGAPDYMGTFARSASRVIPGPQLGMDPDRRAIEGQVFYVFGITGGDIQQSTSTFPEAHATLQFDLGTLAGGLGERGWTLGHGATVYGPPKVPKNVGTEFRSGEVDVVWPHVAGATDYDVYRHDAENAIKQPTTTGGDPDDFVEKLNVRASARTSCGLRVTFENLVNGRKYYFRVRANRDGVELRGRLSAEVSGRPFALRPRGSSAGLSEAAASAPSGIACAQPKEVDPDDGDPNCPIGDGHDWGLRAGGDGGGWCDRVEVGAVVSTVVWRCEASAGEPRAGVGDVVECVRSEFGTVRSRPGPPECEAGFSLETPGGGAQVCSRTDSVPAAATTVYSCEQGFTLVNLGAPFCSKDETEPATATVSYVCDDEGYTFVPGPVGGGFCRKLAAATPTVTFSCPPGYQLLTIQGASCHRSETAKATTTYSCTTGYTLVRIPLGGQYCRKLVAAQATTVYSCRSGYRLVTFFVQPGVAGRRCEKSAPAKATTTYSCSAGYRLVRVPLGGHYCRKSTPATVTYSCPGGYTRGGATCYKYTYKSLTGAKCPAGYTAFFNGLIHLCRKRVTAAAETTYSCTAGRLSGASCVLTANPAAETTYSCSAGRLSGASCVLTANPAAETTYSCSAGRLSGASCVLTAIPAAETTYSCTAGRLSGARCLRTAKPTAETTYSCSAGRLSGASCVLTAAAKTTTTYSCDKGTLAGTRCAVTAPPEATVTYDCDDAPPGYTLSGADCVKTTTRQPTRPTINYCDPGYDLDTEDNTCSRTVTTTATKITVNGCESTPPGEPPYRLTVTTTATGAAPTCERTITIPATIPRSCPTGYNPVITVGSYVVSGIEEGSRVTACVLG